MATYRETGTIEAPLYTDESVHRLLTFYVANGYRVVECRDEAAKPVATRNVPHSVGPLSSVTFERGKPGAGWWTSNMTELHTVVVVESDGERVEISYEVDTSGQMLKEVEQAFWRRELQWAYRYTNNKNDENDEPRDLREEEARRAKRQTSDMRAIGLWGAMTIFIVIVVLGFFGII